MSKLDIMKAFLDEKPGRREEFNEFYAKWEKNQVVKPEGDAFDKLRSQPRMAFNDYVPDIVAAFAKKNDGEPMEVDEIIREYKEKADANGVKDAEKVTKVSIKRYLQGKAAAASGIFKPENTENIYGYDADADKRSTPEKKLTAANPARQGKAMAK